jgi:hypothetical protein
MAVVQINIMKTKQLTFLLALTFLFLFSGSSTAGLFSPSDFNECIFKNMKHAKNKLSTVSTFKACKLKFPDKPKKGPSGLLGPKTYSDCILKYNKGVEYFGASAFIMKACSQKFKKTEDKKNKKPSKELPTFNFNLDES